MTPPGGQSRFCTPAKCPESGRRPVARWLSGRLGIRAPTRGARHQHEPEIFSSRLSLWPTASRSVRRPAAGLPLPVCRTSVGESLAEPRRRGPGIARAYTRDGRGPMGGGKVCAAGGGGRHWNRWSGGRARGRRRPAPAVRGLPPKGSSRWRAAVVPLRRPGVPSRSPRDRVVHRRASSRASVGPGACPGGHGLFPRVA